MKNLFEQSRSHWVRYDHYELKTAEDGKRYITPGKSAKPDVYNPLKEVPNIVLDALNVGMLMMGRKPEAEVEKAVMEFITRYGLLGLMTALPTTPSFMDYEAVYLPKNHFIMGEDERGLHRKARAALGGIAPSYHIELLDKPTIYWDFHSLLLGIQMMFSFMLVDGDQPLRLCKHCQKVFLGSRSNAAFCSSRCKNQYNVYKSRGKNRTDGGDEE